MSPNLYETSSDLYETRWGTKTGEVWASQKESSGSTVSETFEVTAYKLIKPIMSLPSMESACARASERDQRCPHKT